MAETTVTKDNFEEEVLKSDRPVLVDFWAPWCGPCRMLAPVVAEIDAEHPEIKVCKVNIDEEVELAMEYRVASIPTLILMKEGKSVGKMVGFSPKDELVEFISQ